MNKHLLAALLVIPAVLSAGHALANPYINGTQINGLPTPGPVFQGTQINGLPTPGPVFQGAQVNGLPVPGPVFQGTQVNGLLAAGPIVQLIQSQNSATAPNWSALPVSGMTVRLASEI